MATLAPITPAPTSASETDVYPVPKHAAIIYRLATGTQELAGQIDSLAFGADRALDQMGAITDDDQRDMVGHAIYLLHAIRDIAKRAIDGAEEIEIRAGRLERDAA